MAQTTFQSMFLEVQCH